MAAELDYFQVGARLHMPKIFDWFQHRQPADSRLYDYYEFSLAAVMPGATVPAFDRDSMNRVTKGCTALEEIKEQHMCIGSTGYIQYKRKCVQLSSAAADLCLNSEALAREHA